VSQPQCQALHNAIPNAWALIYEATPTPDDVLRPSVTHTPRRAGT